MKIIFKMASKYAFFMWSYRTPDVPALGSGDPLLCGCIDWLRPQHLHSVLGLRPRQACSSESRHGHVQWYPTTAYGLWEPAHSHKSVWWPSSTGDDPAWGRQHHSHLLPTVLWWPSQLCRHRRTGSQHGYNQLWLLPSRRLQWSVSTHVCRQSNGQTSLPQNMRHWGGYWVWRCCRRLRWVGTGLSS